jgi:hypothetical protein
MELKDLDGIPSNMPFKMVALSRWLTLNHDPITNSVKQPYYIYVLM